MPNERLSSVNRIFAAIHRRTPQEIGELLPIGRVFNLRGKVLHYGEVPEIRYELLQFMDAAFVDVLLHTLGIAATPRTAAYMDGSANDLVP